MFTQQPPTTLNASSLFLFIFRRELQRIFFFRRELQRIFLATGLIVSQFINELIKTSFHQSRPETCALLEMCDSHGWPSSHCQNSLEQEEAPSQRRFEEEAEQEEAPLRRRDISDESAVRRHWSQQLSLVFCSFFLNYTAPRIVLATSRVEQEELLSVVEPLLSDLPNVPRPKEPKSTYVGGDFRRQGESGGAHVAIASKVPGGWQKERDAIVLTVLQMLMEGGGSFSAGGPGKGNKILASQKM